MKSEYVCKSEADVETVILFENKNSFASIINRDIYKVVGESPNQQVIFHNSLSFTIFLIRVFEFFAKRKITLPDGTFYELSLFTGGKWFANKQMGHINTDRLIKSLDEIQTWGNTVNEIYIWNGSKHINFKLTRRKMIRIASLLSKHHLLSISGVLIELQNSINDGETVTWHEIIEILPVIEEEIKETRLNYLATSLIELLHNYFAELNSITASLYGKDDHEMTKDNCPDGMSEHFWGLHWTTLTFARAYSRDHYEMLKPTTAWYLKQRF